MISSKKQLALEYQKKTDREHILDAPDTYIGLVDEDRTEGFTFDEGMKWKEFNWVPGLFKLFDEGAVNCRDHFIRLQEKVSKNEKNDVEKLLKFLKDCPI
mgnify:CR=1 FL=1